jgi:hypothetical protein
MSLQKKAGHTSTAVQCWSERYSKTVGIESSTKAVPVVRSALLRKLCILTGFMLPKVHPAIVRHVHNAKKTTSTHQRGCGYCPTPVAPEEWNSVGPMTSNWLWCLCIEDRPCSPPTLSSRVSVNSPMQSSMSITHQML